jgi:hypothetical protein
MIYEVQYKVNVKEGSKDEPQEGSFTHEFEPTLTASKVTTICRDHLVKEKVVMGNLYSFVLGERELKPKDTLGSDDKVILLTFSPKSSDKPKKPKPRQVFAAQAKNALEGKFAECSKRWLFENMDKIETVTHALEVGSKIPVVASQEKKRVPNEKSDHFFEYQADLAFKGRIKECDMQWLFANAQHIEPVAKRLKLV